MSSYARLASVGCLGLTVLMCVALLFQCVFGSTAAEFECKHGRWKFKQFHPAFLLIFSLAMLLLALAVSTQVLFPSPWQHPHVHCLLPHHLAWKQEEFLASLDLRTDFEKLLDDIDPPSVQTFMQ